MSEVGSVKILLTFSGTLGAIFKIMAAVEGYASEPFVAYLT